MESESVFPVDYKQKGDMTGRVYNSPLPPGSFSLRLPQSEDIELLLPEDLGDDNLLHIGGCDIPLFAEGKTVYKGQPLFAAAASSERLLHEFFSKIEIFRNDSLQEGKADYRIWHKEYGNSDNPEKEGGSFFEIPIHRTVSLPPSEYHGAMCCRLEGRKYLFYGPVRDARSLKKTLVKSAGLHSSAITILPTSLGRNSVHEYITTHFGAVCAALLAKKCQKSVYLENYTDYQSTSAPGILSGNYKVWLDPDGKINGMAIEATLKAGELCFAEEVTDRLFLGLAGLYPIQSLSVRITLAEDACAIFSPDLTLGFTSAQSLTEILINRIAHLLEVSPVELRRRFFSDSERSLLVQKTTAGRFSPALETLSDVIRKSDFERQYSVNELAGKRRKQSEEGDGLRKGIGLALGSGGCGFIHSSGRLRNYDLSLKLDTDGSVVIRLPGIPFGRCIQESWKSSISEILDIKKEMVRFDVSSVGTALLGQETMITSRLIKKGCRKLLERRFHEPLPLEEKFRYRPSCSWDRNTLSGSPFSALSWIACVISLSVDTQTGEIAIDGIWLSVDSGKTPTQEGVRNELLSTADETIHLLTSANNDFRGEPDIPIKNRVVTVLNTNRKVIAGVDGLAASPVSAALLSALSQALHSVDNDAFPPPFAAVPELIISGDNRL